MPAPGCISHREEGDPSPAVHIFILRQSSPGRRNEGVTDPRRKDDRRPFQRGCSGGECPGAVRGIRPAVPPAHALYLRNVALISEGPSESAWGPAVQQVPL